MQRTVAEVADPIAFLRAATVSEHDCYAYALSMLVTLCPVITPPRASLYDFCVNSV